MASLLDRKEWSQTKRVDDQTKFFDTAAGRDPELLKRLEAADQWTGVDKAFQSLSGALGMKQTVKKV